MGNDSEIGFVDFHHVKLLCVALLLGEEIRVVFLGRPVICIFDLIKGRTGYQIKNPVAPVYYHLVSISSELTICE